MTRNRTTSARILRAISITFVAAMVLGLPRGRAQGPSSIFHGIGDLPEGTGGVGSAVRDATRVNGTLYAVGSSNTASTGNTLDTPAIWTWAGSGPGTLTALPAGTSVATNALAGSYFSAYAMTSTGDFIASQTRFSNGSRWARVDRSLLPSSTANLDLGTSGVPAFASLAISDSGGVIYGQRTNADGTRWPVRYQPGLGFNYPDLTPTGKTWGTPVPRGTADNGLVMVGIASNGPVTWSGPFPGNHGIGFVSANTLGFRYVHNNGLLTGTTSLIPLLTNGTWNMPVAVTPTGDQTLMIGDSPAFLNGEVYLTNAANVITATYGSPNTTMTPRALGGMTADGSVVAVTFGSGTDLGVGQISGLGIPAAGRYAYIHNSHGWFHFASVLAAQGVDLPALGWDPANMAITGIRTVDGADLVFGQGRRRTVGASGYVSGALEGFVVELPAGAMALFNPAPTPPVDESIVGAWTVGLDPTNPSAVITYLADGTFYFISTAANGTPGSGFERGTYHWAGNSNGGTITYAMLFDTSGTGGLSGLSGFLSRTLMVNGNTATSADTNCGTCPTSTLTRIGGNVNSIVGGWKVTFPGDLATIIGVFLDSPSFKFIQANDEGTETQGSGVELGTYEWNPVLGHLTITPNGGTPDDPDTIVMARDGLAFTGVDDDGHSLLSGTRIIAPSTVVPAITNANLAASGAEDTTFSYTVTALNAVSFEADGLPNGVTIDQSTGVISGTPTVNGTFNVTITVTNSFDATDVKTLVLTFAPPPAGFHGIGDLPEGPGNVGSAVRDATRVNGTLYAVGASITASTAAPANVLDTPALWTWPGSGLGTLTALPPGTGVATNALAANYFSAYAMTSSGDFIASQTRFSNGNRWARVDRSLLFNSTANLDISSAAGIPVAFAALAISDTGVLYGQGTNADTTRTPRRYQAGLGVNVVDMTPTGKTWGTPIPHGTSDNGLVMVGIASNGAVTTTGPIGLNGIAISGTNAVGFRYVHTNGLLTGTTSVIPKITGGTWNMPVALTSTGDQTLMVGDSPAFPNGEVYLTNAANAITATYGSPNMTLTPRALGGMTADGSVVAVTFANGNDLGVGQISGLGIPAGTKYAYVHNSHGWFHFASILAAQGVDLPALGWDPANMAITGIRTVENMDVVFGQGRRRTVGPSGYVNGALEGFVAELPAGAMATFNAAPTPPVDQSIIGAWTVGLDPTNPGAVITYLADGTFYFINNADNGAPGAGFERGTYNWAGNSNGGKITYAMLFDTNGTGGLSGLSGFLSRTIIVNGNTATSADTNCGPCAASTLTRIGGNASSIVGGWKVSVPEYPDFTLIGVFLDGPSFRFIEVGDAGAETDGSGVEVSTYEWNPVLGLLTTTPLGGSPENPDAITMARDGLAFSAVDDNEHTHFNGSRIVAPSAVIPVFSTPMTATGTLTVPFSYPIPVTYGNTFAAGVLPAGLSLDSATGIISGTPTVASVTTVQVSATNSFGSTTSGEVEITLNKSPQADLAVTVASTSAVFGSSFNVGTTGGSSGGAVTFTTSGGVCGHVGSLVTMTGGTGDCLISASMAGNDTYLDVFSPNVTVSAEKASSATALSSSLNPATYGQSITLTATVTSGAGVPSGTVTFADGGTTLGSSPVNGSGVATLVVGLPAGVRALTATYGGSSNFAGSAGNLNQQMAAATTSTALTSSPNPSSPGQPVTFVATVTGQFGGAIAGTVTFKKGPNAIGTAAVIANGTATLTLSNLGTGPHVVTATYGGDSNSLTSSSASVTQNVVAPAAPTTTSVSSSLNPSIAGQSVTLTASVTSGVAGTPSGTITFRLGQNPLATVPMTNGQATYPTSMLPAGSLGITAIYSGDAQFITSTSASLNQVVNKASTTTTLTSSLNPSNLNQAVTFTATVVTSTGAIATGSASLKEGNTTLLTATLNASGVATFNISTLTAGKHNMKVVYAGDANNLNSTSNTLTQTVK